MNTDADNKQIFDIGRMKEYVVTTAKAFGLTNTLRAVDYAEEAHAGQTRKRSDVPYIYHPLNMACHALALGITDDAVIAACLLHDVIEDCGRTLADLPVDAETRELVRLLTHEKTTDENRDSVMRAYFDAIAASPKAALIKCFDRCNNLTSMCWGLSRERQLRMLRETGEYLPRLYEVAQKEPAYGKAVWLLKYQIESMLDIYRRSL